MQQNVLKDNNVVKIILVYTVSGIRKRQQVKLRFMDRKEAFFSAPNKSFIKPKNKTNVEIACYTPDGVYRSNVTLNDTIQSMNEVLFSVSIPYMWRLSQMRASSRKKTELPVSIKFNDGFEISANTSDVSLGGVSFYTSQPVPSIYKQLTGVLSLKLPKETVINFPNGQMKCEARYQREKEADDFFGIEARMMYVFKFLTMTNDDIVVLKNYLLRLEGEPIQ